MSAFTNGFNFGFVSGMFNRMFGGFAPFGGFMPFGGCMPFRGFMSFGVFNPFGGFNFTPNYMQMPASYNFSFNTQPSLWNINNVQQFDFNSQMFSTPMITPNIDWFDKSSVSASNSKSNSTVVTAPRTSGDFDKMLEFVLSCEGGYTPNDSGQAGNKGVRQSTYDSYRKRKGLPTQSVKNITDAEVKDLYYNDYYKASGADKIKDAKLALFVFDTAVNMGVGAAKALLSKSGNDADKFMELRLKKYDGIAEHNEDKKKYLNGWKNRVKKAQNFAKTEFVA